jgi:hypothetical protein
MTLEEGIVAYAANQEGCASQAVLPPPASCSPLVHGLYTLAQWHVLTVIILMFFLSALVKTIQSGFDTD